MNRREDPKDFNPDVNNPPRIDAPVDGDPIPLNVDNEEITSPDDATSSRSDNPSVDQPPKKKDESLPDAAEPRDEPHMPLPPAV